ncbi:hypothetical protein LJR042_002238 [Microbacterium maritypicum]|uniref:polysaccharide deacetylase WbmS family protein n=2 Tax=Microbacteriaceae TaxID=85023 RepID=UPI0035A0769E
MHNVVLTVDVDWAPDWAMKQLLDVLVEAETPSTWFVTHESPMLDVLREHPTLVEIGVHPNFLPGSSHGESPEEVISECLRFAPEARTMRTHCLVQSTPILQTVVDASPISVDASVYLRDLSGVSPSTLPLDHGRSLTRFAYVWEDDLEFFAEEPRWDGPRFITDRGTSDEITIIDVHPIHFALNSASVGPYERLKAALGNMRNVTEADAAEFRGTAPGARTFIQSMLEAKNTLDAEFTTLWSLAESKRLTDAR